MPITRTITRTVNRKPSRTLNGISTATLVLSGTDIADQNQSLGVQVQNFNVAVAFTGEVTSYSKVGTWPTGLSIDEDGNVLGAPGNSGSFTGVSVLAQGPGGTVESNTFQITVSVGAPVAANDAYTVATGTTNINITAGNGVLQNDTYQA